MILKPKISVIIPIYGVELYLNRCVESVVNQSYTNLEIILVDDGSQDNCPSMCEEWKRRDNRIKVIHKMNGGLSDARNVGMKIATGELIGFVDGDDWIATDMYRYLYENMIENNSDISACGVKMVWEGDITPKSLTPAGEYVLNRQEAMKAIVDESILKQPVWYKLYKTELIHNIYFPVGRYHEDVFWSYQAIGNANRISVFDVPCYYYFQRKNSIMGNQYSLKRLDILDAKYERLIYIRENFAQIEKLATMDLWFSCMHSMQMSLQYLTVDDYKIARNKIREILKNMNSVKCIKDMPLKQKIWFYLSKISFQKTCYLRNFLKVGL